MGIFMCARGWWCWEDVAAALYVWSDIGLGGPWGVRDKPVLVDKRLDATAGSSWPDWVAKGGMAPRTGRRRSQRAPAQEMGAGVRACLLTPESGVVVSEEPDTINRPGRVPEGDGRVQEGVETTFQTGRDPGRAPSRKY